MACSEMDAQIVPAFSYVQASATEAGRYGMQLRSTFPAG